MRDPAGDTVLVSTKGAATRESRSAFSGRAPEDGVWGHVCPSSTGRVAVPTAADPKPSSGGRPLASPDHACPRMLPRRLAGLLPAGEISSRTFCFVLF